MINIKPAAKKYLGAAAVAVIAWQLLTRSAVSAQGVRQSLSVCGSILIPSLFPFMVLASLVPALPAGRLAASPFGPVGQLFYRLPRCLAPALMMSWIGGYPAGAHTLAEMVDRGELSPENAGKALCCLVNSGPAFMVTVVGAGIFGNPMLGLQLFGCQLLAGAITGRLLNHSGIGTLPALTHSTAKDKSFSTALVQAVTAAAAAMVSVCAFVLTMGAVTSLFNASGTVSALSRLLSVLSFGFITPSAAAAFTVGSLEICGGCSLAASLAPDEALRVLPFLLSFGGVSVICQVAATVGGRSIPLGRFLLSRPLHGLITQLIAYPLLAPACAAVNTGLITSPVLYADSKTAIGTLLLLGACSILCLTIESS